MRKWFSCRAAGPRQAVISIYDEIGDFGITSKTFIDELRAFGPLSDVLVSINSSGGSVFEGLAIYNYLSALDAKVTVRVEGLAASIASVIAMAGDVIEMPEASWMMVHNPSVFMGGGADEMRKTATLLDDVKRQLVGIYVRRTGIPENEISQLMDVETWMDGREAVAKGFATHLIEMPAVAAHLDLSKFSRVPAAVRDFTLSAKENFMPDTSTAPAAEVQPVKDRQAIVDELAGPSKKSPGNWQVPGQTESPKVMDKAEVEKEAKRMAAEHARKITDVYRSARQLGLMDEAQKLIDDGMDMDAIPSILIDVFAKRNERAAAVSNLAPTGARVVFDHEDPRVILDRMSDAITAQFAPSRKVPDNAREFMGYRAQDFMRNLLDRRGRDTRKMTRAEIVDAALHTTSDFPNLLSTSANKIFMGSYDAAPATFRSIAGRVDLANFQVHNMLRDGDFPSLTQVLESGEFTYGSMSESKETAQVKTYGRTFAISRQSLINDSLGVFGRMVAKIGQATARFENKTVWSVVTSNPTMSDSVALFHSSHANLASPGAAIDATTLGAGRAAMRVQKSLDGETLNVAPGYLVVPAALETGAEQVLYPTTVVTSAAAIATPSQRSLQLVVEPLLDVASTNDWYLFSDPMQGAAIVYGYLEGDTAPRIRVNDPFNVDGVEFQVRLDFHAAAVDYRFAYKNLGGS